MKDLRLIAKLIEKETGKKAEIRSICVDMRTGKTAENIIIDNEFQVFTPLQLDGEITTEDVKRVIEQINRRTRLQEMIKNKKG